MTVESVTQAVSNVALAFGDDDADAGAMVSMLVLALTPFENFCKVVVFD